MWDEILQRLSVLNLEFTSDEVADRETKNFETFLAAKLVCEMEQATRVVCDACSDGHWERVLWTQDGTQACIPCPAAGIVDVPIERLRRWRIDVGRLAALLAVGLEFTQEPRPLPARGWLWHLGRRRFAGSFRDVFFAVSSAGQFAAILSEAQGQLAARTGLLITGADPPSNSDWEPSRLKVVAISDIATWTGGKLAMDLSFIEDLWPRDHPKDRTSAVRSLPIPPGTQWRDVVMTVADTMLAIEIGAVHKELSFAEAGFSKRDQRLETLKVFAVGSGYLRSDVKRTFEGKTPIRNRVNHLRRLLQALIPIDEDPIEYKKAGEIYQCQFKVRLSGDISFPTPSGASWLDFRFVERADGRLAVGVNEKQVFRAHEIERGSGRYTDEVAQQSETITRIFSLEELQLRISGGRLTPTGTALVAFLRGGGRLKRPGDDLPVLKLGLWLKQWTGLNDDPLQYAERHQLWTASFECSSEQTSGE